MSRKYKLTVAIILFTLVFVGFCFLTGNKGVSLLWLLFLMPALWTLWLVCAVLDKERKAWKLAMLWALIDIAVLSVASLLAGNVHEVGGRIDTEYLYAIAFFPLILPVILISAVLPWAGAGLSAISRGASYILLPEGIAGLLPDWLDFSILSAISAYLFVIISHYYWKTRKKE